MILSFKGKGDHVEMNMSSNSFTVKEILLEMAVQYVGFWWSVDTILMMMNNDDVQLNTAFFQIKTVNYLRIGRKCN
jgi:hypothetical protein